MYVEFGSAVAELYHELHWERDRDTVIQFALDWMAQA